MDASALCDLLVSWSHINSGSANFAGLARMRDALMDEFRRIPGAEVVVVPLAGSEASALHVRQRPGVRNRVLLSGHYDTVYGAEHAFQRCERLDADTLRGPGVADMKGGIVVMLAALQAFERSVQAADLGWDVVLTPDEETGSVASRPLLESLAPQFRCALVFEPARENGDLVQSRKGTGLFHVTCHGRAAHAGRNANEGRNAIVALAEFVVAINRISEELPGVLLNVGAIEGGGAVNIVPDLARAAINLRIARGFEAAAVRQRLDAHAAKINARDGCRLEIEGQFHRLPMESDAALFALWQQCASEEGLKAPGWTHVGGASDGNLLSAAGLPCLDGLGVVGGHLHSAMEYIQLSSLTERSAVAARVLTRLSAEPLN